MDGVGEEEEEELSLVLGAPSASIIDQRDADARRESWRECSLGMLVGGKGCVLKIAAAASWILRERRWAAAVCWREGRSGKGFALAFVCIHVTGT